MDSARRFGGLVAVLLSAGACGGPANEPVVGRSEQPLPPATATPSAEASPAPAPTPTPPLDPVPLEVRLQDTDPATTKELSLERVKLESLEPLAAYVHLEDLDVSGTGVSDIAALAKMPKLRRLSLADTKVRDITVLSKLPNLTWLDLQLCHDVPPEAFAVLRQLRQLDYVDALGTQLSSLAPFVGLPKLTSIAIDFTPVSDMLTFASGPTPGAPPPPAERQKHAQEARRAGKETQREYAQLEKLRARGVRVEIDCMCEDLRPDD